MRALGTLDGTMLDDLNKDLWDRVADSSDHSLAIVLGDKVGKQAVALEHTIRLAAVIVVVVVVLVRVPVDKEGTRTLVEMERKLGGGADLLEHRACEIKERFGVIERRRDTCKEAFADLH